ncbi:hypothetical protein VXN63_06995 [Marinilactibacillus sp. XAAS-LB27]|uniref:hypothetical protein n=1 Tax=Marinilactibacillus sp. XAAS-LB27 TaxID=3114538 RepID=UPI002E17A1D3|nr:hypothetical protein [Marinilactibacillus sp. XAAS-LB27]
MVREVVFETIKYMWRSKKNRLFMILTLGVMLAYSVVLLPNTAGLEEVDVQQLEREMLGNEQTYKDALVKGQTVPTVMTGTSAYEAARTEFLNQRQLLTALKQGDARRYLEIGYRPDITERVMVQESLDLNVSVMGREAENVFQPLKNQAYIYEVEALSFHIVHDRTSLQQIHLFLIGLGPVLLCLGAIFMISDITVKDRKLTTQKAGVPMKWADYLFVQSITAMSFVLLFYLFSASIFFVINGLLYGFGTLSLPVGLFQFDQTNRSIYTSPLELFSIGQFLIRTVPFFLLILYLISKLNTIFSLLFKQEVVVLISGAFMILFQQLYYGVETTELLGINISWFPQTYLDFGKIVTGRVNEAMIEGDFYMRGILVLSVTILIAEVLVYLTAKHITRQKFVR